MSEELKQEEQIPNDVKQSEYDIESIQKELETLRKEKLELLNEAKKAKNIAKQSELEKAQKNGDFENLLKNEREEKDQIIKDFESFKNNYRQEKVKNQAARIANELAPNPQAANLLTRFLEDKVGSIADEDGNLNNDLIESVKKEVKNNQDYAPLVAGNKSSGGGAPGAGSGAAGGKEMSMSDYEKLSPLQKLEFSKAVQSGKAKLI